MDFDWHRILFSDHPYSFFIEILIRTPLMFLAVVFILRLTGKRGVQQLSIFEMVMIITLGSAAGDSMFYDDVGILHALAVFVLVLAVYRILIFFIAKSAKAEHILEGEPVYIIRDGQLCLEEIGVDLGSDEFFGELRVTHVEHLGQLRYVVLEDSGKLSVFYYADEDVKYGLPILPDEYGKKSKITAKLGFHSCARCGYTKYLEPGKEIICERCDNTEWVASVNRKRIT